MYKDVMGDDNVSGREDYGDIKGRFLYTIDIKLVLIQTKLI